ncbi:MAG TPA: DUF4124 domain-containing protein [Usitatibacter sp.]|jgi:hypothetical protein
MARRHTALRTALLIAALATIPCAVLAQVLYKWTDNDGRTQYSDQPPKNFAGPVTKIEPDEKATPSTPLPGTPEPKSSKADDQSRSLIEMAAKKRAVRDKLDADLVAARARLVAAQAQLDNASPAVDERMTIQQRQDAATPLPGPGSATTGGMFGMGGMNGTAPRSNCSIANNANGTPVETCRAFVPGEAYYDRLKKLQDAVASAEADVAAAETAYRRGVD